MKSSRNRAIVTCCAVAAIVVAARGELARWVENIDGAGRLEAVFFRTVAMPGGPIPVRRPPKETRPELDKLISAAPSDADLYSLRALEAEQQLDFDAAERDWKKYSEIAADRAAGRLALADFYHRRLRSDDEFAALAFAARELPPASEKLLPPAQQRPSRIYERLLQLLEDQAMPVDQGVIQYRLWIQQYPKETWLYARLHAFALAKKRYAIAEETSVAYERAFPQDPEFPIVSRAEAASQSGDLNRAQTLYESAFRPLWPATLVKNYFALLAKTGSLRKFLEQARAAAVSDPTGINGPARLFYYYQQQGDLAAAQRALAEFRLRKESRKASWTAAELTTLAALYESTNNWDDAARFYYALYSLPNVDAANAERALAGLANILLAAPEQGIRFGSGNLSFWQDAATLDSHPGFLNGILSLVLNTSDPQQRYASQNQASLAYFHRARATELLTVFDTRFPTSSHRPALHGRLIDAYVVYGDSDAVIRSGQKFLTDFPNAANRTSVASRLADAYAQKGQTQQEFGLYEDLLKEFATKAEGVPIGDIPKTSRPATQPAEGAEGEAQITPGPARSPEYARILDRYLARLVSLKRTRDALALYRREVDRNPNDPGLYERLAGFLEQNKITADVEAVYQRAIRQFEDKSWSHKLARWYLRRKQTVQLDKLTQDVVRTFAGTDLEAYLREAIPQSSVTTAFYLQVNKYAAQRFPHNLTFVRNLLNAYSFRATGDAAAYEALLRKNWYYADDLRGRFFELLSRTNRLDAELQALRTLNPTADLNPAGTRLLAEGEAWRSHFELAAPALSALQANYPADQALAARAGAVERSLASIDPAKYPAALAIETRRQQFEPRNTATLARIGEIEAERDRLNSAKPNWNRIAAIEPGKPDGYLEAATVFWDYFQYDDALRLIEEGRRKLARPALYSYEAGAIQENKRDYDRAIAEYTRGALAAYSKTESHNQAESRLLILARRPALRAKVDLLTANLTSARTPSPEAFALRISLLRNQNRREDLERFLVEVCGTATSMELLAQTENWGRVEGFSQVQQRALERQVALTTDPIDKMRARIALARFFESQGKTAEGGQTVDALVRESPAILGVVRAAVDYHWRNKNSRRAIDLLTEAAGRSSPDFKRDFTFEAARKATEAADYNRARTLLGGLLASDPWDATYISAMSDTYGRKGDDTGLRAFYTTKLEELRGAQLSTPEKNERAGGMRRGLIPVLTRMKDYAGALDQYVEVINKFPEDDVLTREAAAYANRYNSRAKLLDFYRKTQGEAPRDARWPVVLARLETLFEDFPAAITSYNRAAEIRPERTDLLIARAQLEERLMRFDDAAKTYTRLHELTYRDSQWMDKLATIRVRQGKTGEAVTALRKAWIEGRPDRATNYATVAEKLESWNLLNEAASFAEEAMKRAEDNEKAMVSIVFARLAARGRRYEAAYLRAPVDPMADIATAYYTPEEKTGFAAFVQKLKPRVAINAARRAKLTELEARLLFDTARATPGKDEFGSISQLIALQSSRLKFDELGAQLEAYWKLLPADADNRDNILLQAAEAYRAGGNATAELRVLTARDQHSSLDGPSLDRYMALLMAQPARLAAVAGRGRDQNQENAIVDYAIRNGTLAQATQVIEARGRKINPLWTRAYTALTGVYFGSTQLITNASFVNLLEEATIGERLGKPIDRSLTLAGDAWFYYGARYGEYLISIKQKGAENYLPSEIEHTPGRAEAYFRLAEYYREQGDRAHAAEEYRHVLELAPNRADVHDRLALLAVAEGKSSEAAAEWKLAFDALARQQDESRVPASFWTNLQDALIHAGQAKALGPLHDDVSKLLRTYVRRNGAYQIDPLFRGVLAASADPAAGIAWIAELSRSAADPPQFLSSIVQSDWIPEAQRDAVYQEILRGAAAKLNQSFGDARSSARARERGWQIEYVQFLLERRQFDRASAILAEVQKDAAQYGMWDQLSLEARIAAKSRAIPGLLDRIAQKRDDQPSAEQLRRVASELKASGEGTASRALLKWVYDRELDEGRFEAANFLGAAEVKLEEGDAAGAVALLRRMTLLSGEPFDSLEDAAALLDRFKRRVDALEFAEAAAKAKPWDFAARRTLAEWRSDAPQLGVILNSADAPYAVRTEAALAMRRLKASAPQTSSTELLYLASSAPIPEAAALGPYLFAASLQAGRETADPASKIKLLSAALAVDPKAGPPRSLLFEASAQARRDRLTTSIYQVDIGNNEEADFQPWIAEQFLAGSGLDQPQRALAARRLGEARQRLGSLTGALVLFRVAEKLEEAEQAKVALRRTIAALKVQVDRRIANDARRPIVTSNIEQDRPVRPRLAATAAQGGPR